MIDRIVTHPGGAHKDDFLAVCVLASKFSAPIVRRDPTPAELEDARTAVVDVGGAHQPELLNFDHHHFPRDHAPTCALSLVLSHLGLYEQAKALCDWLETAEWFDSRGPVKTAEWLGVPRRAISRLNSPIDVTLLRRFAASARLEPGEPLYEVMRFVGEDLLDHLERARERTAFAARHVEVWRLDRDGDSIEVAFLQRTDPIVDEPRMAVEAYVRVSGLERRVAAVAYPDRRGSGYGLSRYEDHPDLDFGRVRSEPDVTFAHATGFVCKTEATDPQRLKWLLERAWRPRSRPSA